MSPQNASFCSLLEIERLERVPLAKRLVEGSTYALLQKWWRAARINLLAPSYHLEVNAR